MNTETAASIVGILSVGLIVIGTYLLVPKRRLSIRERMGVYIIWWGFIIYAMWLAYTQPGSPLIKNCSLLLVFLYGSAITLLCQLMIEPPTLDIKDAKLRKITFKTWIRLRRDVKAKLRDNIVRIREVPKWDKLTQQALTQLGILRNPAKWQQGGEIQISKTDCAGLSDKAISGAIAHEFAHAYQSTLNPDDIDAIERAGDELPKTKWGFKKEIKALRDELSDKTNSY